MEYNLQKTIEPNLLMHSMPNSTYPSLSAYPATDYVNPGIGQISKLYSFIVPLHNHQFQHEIRKSSKEDDLTESNEQLGAGEKDSEVKILDKLNEKKRKLLGDGVYDSFMHPKAFQTKKVFLNADQVGGESKHKHEKNSNIVTEKESTQNKKVNHKFQFY